MGDCFRRKQRSVDHLGMGDVNKDPIRLLTPCAGVEERTSVVNTSGTVCCGLLGRLVCVWYLATVSDMARRSYDSGAKDHAGSIRCAG